MNHAAFDVALAAVNGATLLTVILGLFKASRWSGLVDARLDGLGERLHRIEDHINNS